LITGTGGQGVILLGNILRDYGLKTSIIKSVVGTETKGVSQREGSVIATVRYLLESQVTTLDRPYQADELISPLIPINDAHLILGLEPLETLRNIKFISKQTIVVVNTHRNYPRTVLLGSEKEKIYPSNVEILKILNQLAKRTFSTDFNYVSRSRLGTSLYANIMVLGAGIKEFKEIFNEEIVKSLLIKSFGENNPNIESFEIGFGLNENSK
jgi:indolepyruvate ferredoxin oxidoreductase beta subunit